MSLLNTMRFNAQYHSSRTRAIKRFATVVSIAMGLFGVQLLATAQSSTTVNSKGAKTKTTKPPKMKATKTEKKMMPVMAQKSNLMAPSRIVLVFPTDSADANSGQLSDAVTDVEQGRLSASGAYQTVYFLRSIPTIKRALNEGLAPIDASKPFDKDDKIKQLCQITGYNLAILSNVDSYAYDKDKNQVGFILTISLIDYSGEKPVKIGSVVSQGDSPAGGNAKETDLANALARTLTEKIMSQILQPKK